MRGSTNNPTVLAWNPQKPSQFVVGHSDLRLYEYTEPPPGRQTLVLRSADEDSERKVVNTPISLLAVNPRRVQVQCLAWAPKDFDSNTLAVGLPSGNVILTSFGRSRIPKEFVPKPPRGCHALAWNQVHTKLLAVGTDKVRNGRSVLLWDVTRSGRGSPSPQKEGVSLDAPLEIMPSQDQTYQLGREAEPTDRITTPSGSFSNNEAVCSLAWLKNPAMLAVGTTQRWLRIYDVRKPAKAAQSVVAHVKGVRGVGLEPFDQRIIFTHSEASDVVKLWDSRMISQPLMTVNTSTSSAKGFTHVSWCPTRSGVLATVATNSYDIKLWDIKDQCGGLDVANASSESRLIREIINVESQPFQVHRSPEQLADIAWHPTHPLQLLTMGVNGMVEVLSLHRALPFAMSPGGIGVAAGDSFVEGSWNPVHGGASKAAMMHALSQHDIGSRMRRRAHEGYATDISANVALAEKWGDASLARMWKWMQATTQREARATFPGIRNLLQDDQSIVDTSSGKQQNPIQFTTYTSAIRSQVLDVCGWGFRSTNELAQYVNLLATSGHACRAAALALWHCNLELAVAVLQVGAAAPARDGQESTSMQLDMIAMALAGYSSSSGLWMRTCSHMRSQVSDPYLRFALSFLSSEAPSECAPDIMRSPDLDTLDRIAFGVRFLSDELLGVELDFMMKQMDRVGDLEGIILTGLTKDGVELLQRYIDRTAMSHVVPRRFRDPNVNRWVASYRLLLDRWCAWEQRALLDAHTTAAAEPPAPQVFARCNFCSTPLSLPMLMAVGKGRSGLGGTHGTSTQQRFKSCPKCKKTLPKCSICLLPPQCTLPPPLVRSSAVQPYQGTNSFSKWFSWCQTCRHGGHAGHLLDWFEEHSECPVTDCTCRCGEL